MKRSIFISVLLLAFTASSLAQSPVNPRILPGTIASNEAILYWEKPAQYQAVAHYEIYVNGVKAGASEKNNYKIENLKPSSRHRVVVTAVYKKGKPAAGTIVEFDTKPAPEILNVRTFGAKGDGVTIDTKAIQEAIDKCPANGEVYIPAGEYVTGALFVLKSNININIAKGATLRAVHNLGHFPMVKYHYEGWGVNIFSSVLNIGKLDTEERYSDIRIFGGGTIDNQGTVLSEQQSRLLSRMSRSHGLPVTNCDRVAVDGITVTNPCTWNIHPMLCTGFTTYNTTMISALPGLSNADSWDPDSSSDCYLLNSVLDGQDDNIAIKSIRYTTSKGEVICKPSQNIYINHCRLVRGGGICIGAEMPSGVRNVWIEDCVVENSDRGFHIAARPEPTGTVENIYFRDITVLRTGCWGINITSWYYVQSYIPGSFKAQGLRTIRNINFENITIKHADGNPIQILGMPEGLIWDVKFKNVTIESCDYDVLLRNCRNVTFENVKVGERYWVIDNAENVTVDKLTSRPKTVPYPYRLVDEDATYATKAMYANLHKVANSGKFLFGAQDATASGYGWNDNSGRSDIEMASGKTPALFSWDFMHIAKLGGSRTTGDDDKIRRLTSAAFFEGGINSYCWHCVNPVTGGNFYDTTQVVVRHILPGGTHHDKFIKLLDQIVEFNKTLIGKNGEHIPIIFRPWHEFDGNWFWWGKNHCTAEEFKELYRFTVTYLRDTGKVHNFLYAFSPDCGYNSTEEYLERYPGDEYVDIIATDNYWDFRIEQPDLDIVHRKLKIISDYAAKSGKIAALSETGQARIDDPKWFTDRLLKAIYGYPGKVNLAYVALWRGSIEGFFVPYVGHPAQADFCEFTADPRVIMGSKYDYMGQFYHID